MRKKNKDVMYIRNNGYAFNAEDDMKKLSELAGEGWVLTGFKRSIYYYKLERSTPENVVYNIDMYKGEAEDLDEYFETFRAAGWEVIEACKIEQVKKKDACRIYVFKAPAETAPIYTDAEALKETFRIERDEWLVAFAKHFGFALLFAVVFVGLAFLLTGGFARSVLLLIVSLVSFWFYCMSATYATGLVGFWIKAKNGEYKVSKRNQILLSILSITLTAGIGGIYGYFMMLTVGIDILTYLGIW
ncbi:MAG: DUF2812 domain-containing protein [Turicibacter sp.]|nr:DUF2812 domain-containing protein [Turicibacter sp.]